MQLPKINIQLWSVILLAFILGLGAGAFFGNKYGRAIINNDWSEEKVTQANAATNQSETNRGAEQQHTAASNEVSSNAQVSQEKYKQDIADVQLTADSRVRESEARADKYRAMSQASKAEQERLANYAARLDGSLTEGRQLAQELRATLAERDRTIQILKQQIDADRKLTGEY